MPQNVWHIAFSRRFPISTQTLVPIEMAIVKKRQRIIRAALRRTGQAALAQLTMHNRERRIAWRLQANWTEKRNYLDPTEPN